MADVTVVAGAELTMAIGERSTYVRSMWEHLPQPGQQQPTTVAPSVGDSCTFRQLSAAVAARG